MSNSHSPLSRSVFSWCVGMFSATVPMTTDAQTFNRPHLVRTDCWEIHSLGTLGGPFSYATDLNNKGEVVGNAATEPRIKDPADPPWTLSRGFVSQPNGGPLTEILTEGYWFGNATAINEQGAIVGDTTLGRSFPVSFVADPGGGNVRVTLAWTYVRDINNVGQTLWDRWYPFFEAFIGPNEQPDQQGTDLIKVDAPMPDPYQDFLTAVALNDSGQVAVNVRAFDAPQFKAYRWSAAEGAVLIDPTGLGSEARQMNDVGQVIGIATTKSIADGNPGIYQSFVTSRFSPTPTLLGTPGDGNEPKDINNWGQIVGVQPVNGVAHGYVTPAWNPNRHIDLDGLDEVARDGWTNIRPAAINDRGQIAGTGRLGGNDLAFLLTPLSLQAYVPTADGSNAKCYRLTR